MPTKYTKEILEDAVNNATSYAGVLRYLGLKQAGGTQHYISRCIRKLEIETKHFTGQSWSRGVAPKNKKVPRKFLYFFLKDLIGQIENN